MMLGFVKSPPWDENSKGFSLRLLKVKTWRFAIEGVNGLEGVHGLQLMLHLPKGIAFGWKIFYFFDNDAVKGENGWNTVIHLLKLH